MKARFPRRASICPMLGALVQAFALLGLVLSEPGYAAAAAQTTIARASPPEASRPTTTTIEDHAEGEPFTSEQLETLLGPVALYPDELLAIVLPASTYPLQIVQAARFLEKHEADDSLQPDEGWDESVLGLLNYPEVIELMNDDLNWTWQLGEAAANQQQDVMDSVQRFRAKARDAGNLVTNEQMVVTEEEQEGAQVVIIESSSTEVIYVPVYQPSTVVVYHGYPYPYYYSPPYPYYYHRRAVFWTGMRVGVAVGYGCRWGRSSSVTVNRNVNINVDRPGGGNRPGGGDGPGGGDRPGNRPETRPSQGGAQDWKAVANRGKQSGGRPGNAATRPSSGTRPGQAGTRDRAGSPAASNRAGSSDRSKAAARPSSGSNRSRDRSGSSASRNQSRRNGSFGSYQSRSASQQQRARGALSRGGGSRGGGGYRGGGRGGGGRRR